MTDARSVADILLRMHEKCEEAFAVIFNAEDMNVAA